MSCFYGSKISFCYGKESYCYNRKYLISMEENVLLLWYIQTDMVGGTILIRKMFFTIFRFSQAINCSQVK